MTAAPVSLLARLRARHCPETAPVTAIKTVPLIRPALAPEEAAVLRTQVAALNAEFGPVWHVWLSNDPAGRLYATGRGATEHAETSRKMRSRLTLLTLRERSAEDAALASWTDEDAR